MRFPQYTLLADSLNNGFVSVQATREEVVFGRDPIEMFWFRDAVEKFR